MNGIMMLCIVILFIFFLGSDSHLYSQSRNSISSSHDTQCEIGFL